VFSQEIRDKLSSDKISFVEIYSDKGDLIGVTNVGGIFSIDLKNKIKSSKTEKLAFVNSFFETKIIETNDFNDGAIFKMNPIINELKEVVVLTPIKQEYYSKFRLLIMRLIFSSLLGVYQSSIFP
jgi:hypothetical protein